MVRGLGLCPTLAVSGVPRSVARRSHTCLDLGPAPISNRARAQTPETGCSNHCRFPKKPWVSKPAKESGGWSGLQILVHLVTQRAQHGSCALPLNRNEHPVAAHSLVGLGACVLPDARSLACSSDRCSAVPPLPLTGAGAHIEPVTRPCSGTRDKVRISFFSFSKNGFLFVYRFCGGVPA